MGSLEEKKKSEKNREKKRGGGGGGWSVQVKWERIRFYIVLGP